MELSHYSEDAILAEIRNHIATTYGGHYVAADAVNVQVLDIFEDWENEAFCKINATKYLKRFGKKKGRNREDLLKAAHYVIMMMHYASRIDNIKESDTTS